MKKVLIGCGFAVVPSLAVGLLVGIIMSDWGVGAVVGAGVFGFGLDMLFGKGSECRQYEK